MLPLNHGHLLSRILGHGDAESVRTQVETDRATARLWEETYECFCVRDDAKTRMETQEMTNRNVTIAATVVLCAFMTFCAVLILANHAQDLRGFLILCGQAVGFALQFWLVHRAASSTKRAVEETTSKVENVGTKVDKVQQAVNGNTPPELPRVKTP